ncbi:MAG: MBL fold metallo-hydrolase [Eubacterium sp.]|nr:MBL fold metallo-hydrolase [Eubacterium sp.]
MNKVTLLKYSNTNTYIIEGSRGTLLFDTGWAGTFNEFCGALGEAGKKLQDISYILISHFHPDHMGIAQEIAEHGPVIALLDVQKDYIHSADNFFIRNKEEAFRPIVDDKVVFLTEKESRSFLEGVGLAGELIHTPGHSEDSISLWLDDGELFVGDLNPLYELELHKGTETGRTWAKLLQRGPRTVYYGHAKTAELQSAPTKTMTDADMYKLVSQIIKYIDRGYSLERIEDKTGADSVFIEDVNRMYLTHRNVGVQGILDRIEIKNK